MIKQNFVTKNYIQKKHLYNNSIKKLSKKYKKIIKEINYDVNSLDKTLNVLSDKYEFNFKIKNLKKFKKYKTIAIIGMGGSILGAEAIYSFLKKKIKKKVYFFNNIDAKKNTIFKKKKNLNKVLFLIISKSGNTIETLSNFSTLNIIKKNAKNLIIISEKKNNLLYLISKKYNLFYIEHKSYIGGRYSVLSEVGMLPAYFMGVNIFKIRSKIKIFLTSKKIFLKDSALKLANLLNSKKFNNLIFLNYSPEIEKFLYWSQQLIAESLGKKGKGFLPVISSAPKDHHSLLQLYLDGPRDKIFNIFSLDDTTKEKVVFKKDIDSKSFLNKKNLNFIKNAQKRALIASLKKNKIPFREFKINKVNEEVIGELFSYFVLETVIVGKLIKINPFDQPAVEQVKTYTKKFLT